MVALGGHGNPPLQWDYLFRVHRQKPRSLRKLAMTNKRVVIAIGAQRREAISGGNMRSRRKLAMTSKRVVIVIRAQQRESISGGNMRSLRKLAMTNKRVVIAIGAQRREAISGGNMRSRRKLVVTNKRVVIAIRAQRREAISGGNMRSRRKLVVTNFVFFASFVVQNRVNRRIDRSSAEVLICRSPVGATLRAALPVPCKGIEPWLPWADMEIRPYDGIMYFGCIAKN